MQKDTKKLLADAVLLYLLKELRQAKRNVRFVKNVLNGTNADIERALAAEVQARNTYYGMLENIRNNYRIRSLETKNGLQKAKHIVITE